MKGGMLAYLEKGHNIGDDPSNVPYPDLADGHQYRCTNPDRPSVQIVIRGVALLRLPRA